MTATSWITIVATVGAVLFLWLSVWLIRDKVLTRARRRKRDFFGRAVVQVLGNENDPEARSKQVERHYRSFAAAMIELGAPPISLANTVWWLVEGLDLNGLEKFQKRFDVEMPENGRGELTRLVDYLEEKQPFSQLPPRWANRLEGVRRAMSENAVDAGNRALEELAQELIIMEERTQEEQERRDKKNTRLAIAGIVISVLGVIVGVAVSLIVDSGLTTALGG